MTPSKIPHSVGVDRFHRDQSEHVNLVAKPISLNDRLRNFRRSDVESSIKNHVQSGFDASESGCELWRLDFRSEFEFIRPARNEVPLTEVRRTGSV